MADFSSKVTDLGKPNISFRERQGVVDQSKAMGIQSDFNLGTNLGGLAIDKVQQIHQEGVLEGIAGEVGDVIREQEERSFSGQQNLYEETVQLEGELDTIRTGAGYDGTYPDVLNQQLTDDSSSVKNNLVEKTERLSKAREQGIMTEGELETRLNTIAQEAIARNPALAREIMGHISTVSDLYGLTGKVKADMKVLESEQKVREEYAKSIIKQADELGLPLSDPKYFDQVTGGYNIDAVRADMRQYQEKDFFDKNITRQANTDAKLVEVNEREFIQNKDYTKYNDARIDGFKRDVFKILQGPGDDEQKQNEIQRIQLSKVEELKKVYRMYLPGTDLTKGELGNSIAHVQETIKLLSEQAIGQITGKVSGDIAKAQNEAAYIIAENDMIKNNPDLPHMKVAAEMIKGVPEWANFPSLQNAFTDLGNVLGQGSANYLEQKNLNRMGENFTKSRQLGNKNKIEYVLESSIDAYKDNPKVIEVINEKLDSTVNFLSAFKTSQEEGRDVNPMQKTNAILTITDFANNPQVSEEMIGKMDKNTKKGVEYILNEYISTGLKNYVTKFKDENPDAQLIVREDGTLDIENYDPRNRAHADFMSKGSRRIEEAFTGINKFNGNRTDASSFYTSIGVLGASTEKK